MSYDRFQFLLDRYLSEEIQPDERQDLLVMMNDTAYLKELEADIEAGLLLRLYEMEPGDASAANIKRHFSGMAPKETTGTVVRQTHFFRRGWFRYAAALVLVVGVAAYFRTTNKKTEQTLANSNKTLRTDVLPGGERAMLTLADGRTIALDSAANGQIANQGQTQVVKLTNGQVAYNMNGPNPKEVMWNTVSTPKGGQYQVTLPDGTKVWLNTSSSITFPTAFVSGRREVKITGEVYFEVAEDKQKPFVADVDGKSVVEVLGTRFNVNAYADEGTIKTTLLEGSVKVKAGDKNAILSPGQQAQMPQAAIAMSSDQPLKSSRTSDYHGIIVTSHVDIDQILAWKNGLFSFNNADLQSVMRQLERWYDIKVQYQGAVSTVSLKGKMYRNVSLSTILEFLRKMGVRFRMEGKTLIVL